MENAKWNGVLYVATDVSKKYEIEKCIRKASGRRELRCIDPDCDNPVIKYCHGSKSMPYFAHIRKSSCEYEEFDRENTPIIRSVKSILYDVLKTKGFDVQLDVKIVSHHYTHLLIDNNGNKLAIELTSKSISANRIDYIASKYKESNVKVKWVIVNDLESPSRESDLPFIKRFIVNETDRKDVLEITPDGRIVYQYMLDPNKYEYKGRELQSVNYPQIYQVKSYISMLTIENQELTISGFFDKYTKWLNTKKEAFSKKILSIQNEEKRLVENSMRLEAEKRRLEEERLIKAREIRAIKEKQQFEAEEIKKNEEKRQMTEIRQKIEIINSLIKKDEKAKMIEKSDQEYLSEINDDFSNGEKMILDSLGRRWLKCKVCGRKLKKDAFAVVGRFGEYNLGTCWKCHNSKFY